VKHFSNLHHNYLGNRVISRRQMLQDSAGGLGALALSWLISQSSMGSEGRAAPAHNLLAKQPHFAPKAKRVVFIFLGGGPSQMDLLDPKPMLTKYHGESIPFSVTQRSLTGSTKLMASPFKFQKYGQSGIEVSELLPGLSKVVDDIAVIRSGVTTRIDHGEALLLTHTGRPLSGFPSMGAWVSYGLGSENENLPAYVAIPDTTPVKTHSATSAGWLPPVYQGTPFHITGSPIHDLQRPESTSAKEQGQYLELTQMLNRQHQESRPSLADLDARVQNFELAARMQVEAIQKVDLSTESVATKKLYGLDNRITEKFGKQCLIARRLLESGVRFVHLIRNDWDHHSNLNNLLTKSTQETDQPVAALVQDLKRRGLLDDTLVIWAGEFGRLPVVQGLDGRDHNPFGYTFWMAGGGIRGGTIYGATDEFGYRTVENPVTVADFHATVLHLLGLDHRRVTYEFEGRDESLTGVENAEVIHDILA
tara:strand:- start:448 stop:1881 length:1434 start_codon:yes stop_codon:yes gene_type:complete